MNRPTETDCSWCLPEPWRPPHPVFAFHEDSNSNACLITPEGRIYAVAEERRTRFGYQPDGRAVSFAWGTVGSGD